MCSGQVYKHLTPLLTLMAILLGLTGCFDVPDAPQFRDVGVENDSGTAPQLINSMDAVVDSAIIQPDLPDPASSNTTERNLDANLDSSACMEETAELEPELATLWGPASRISRLEFPIDADHALEAGCQTVGSNWGLGAEQLPILLGFDFGSAVQKQEDGSIDLILLAHFKGWQAGQTASEQGRVYLAIYEGDPSPDGEEDVYLIERASFIDADPNKPPYAQFDARMNGCFMSTGPGMFLFKFSGSGLPFELPVVTDNIRGNLEVLNSGITVSNGVLTGYLTQENVARSVGQLQEICMGMDPPSFCSVLNTTFGDRSDEDLVELFINLLGGLDSRYRNGVAEACSGPDCNAVSICLLFEASAARIIGQL